MSATFSHLLKDWRGRRRMSQLALGLKADVSSRHIAFLETGRANPSRVMVMRLAEALDVPLAVRNAFLDTAGFASVYGQRDFSAADMTHVRAAIDWSLQRHLPYPAFAKDRHWKLVAANAVARNLLQAVGIDLGDSLLNLLVAESRLTSVFANPGEVGHFTLSRLRIESAYLGGDAVLDDAARRIAAIPVVRDFDVPQHLPPVLPALYRSGTQTYSLFALLAQFGSAEDLMLADLQIELLYPADEATKQWLQAISPS